METEKLERGSGSRNDLQAWGDLIQFQLTIAERWLRRGTKIEDIFAKFFFYFAGFNAVYFLWRKIDGLDQTNEGRHIENLLKKFDEAKAQEMLDKIKISVDYFSQRRPIQRMDRRSSGRPYVGDKEEGHNWSKKLQNNDISALERLVAVGHILYLVRSNLAHGSKAERGDDREVIERSMEPLRVLLTEAISLTKHQCSWRR